MINIPTVGVAALLLIGCLAPGGADSFPMRALAKGAFSALLEPKEEVIKDKAQWEKVWAKHITSTKTSEKAPEVDFAKEMVIAVALGRRSTGGYKVDVTKVEEASGKLRIVVTKSSPPPGAMAIQALTAPFCFVAIPKSDLPPEFVDVSTPPKGKPQ